MYWHEEGPQPLLPNEENLTSTMKAVEDSYQQLEFLGSGKYGPFLSPQGENS